MMKTLVTLFAATMIMASCSNGASTSTSATADSTIKDTTAKAAMTHVGIPVTATDSSKAKAPVKDTVKKSK